MNLLFKILLSLIVILLTLFLIERTTSLEFGLATELAEPHSEDDDDDINNDEDDEKIHIVDGYKAVELEDEVLAASGIKFEKLKSLTFKPEFSAYAEVINIASLVSLKTEYSNLLSEEKILQKDLHNQNLILKRAMALHKTKSLSTRELEKNRADRDLKASKLSAMNIQLENLDYEIKSNWGDEISKLVLNNDKQEIFNQLARHEGALILVSLLKEQTLQNEQQNVFVSGTNQRDLALAVSYLDRANQISNPLYGESYIYFLESEKLSPGIRLFAWIEESGDSISGLLIPDSAVIWYASEAWVYVKHEDNLFVRKPVGKARKLPEGWLVDGITFHDAELVIQGGQTLLSEEFKWAIPDEDDD